MFNVQLFGRTRTDIDRRTSYHTTAVALHPTTMVAGRQPPTSPPQSYATVPMSPLTSTTPHGPKPHPYHHHNRTLRAYQNDNAATSDDGDDHEDHDHDNGRSNGPGCGGTDDDGDDDGAAAGGIGGGDGDGGRDSERGDGDGDGDAGSGDADVDGDNGDRVATVVMRAWARTVGTQTGTTLLLILLMQGVSESCCCCLWVALAPLMLGASQLGTCARGTVIVAPLHGGAARGACHWDQRCAAECVGLRNAKDARTGYGMRLMDGAESTDARRLVHGCSGTLGRMWDDLGSPDGAARGLERTLTLEDWGPAMLQMGCARVVGGTARELEGMLRLGVTRAGLRALGVATLAGMGTSCGISEGGADVQASTTVAGT
ncbi:hypothetical protein EDB89DRAFT_1900649 [Lactarius sanguifluus]|nr:hypothetical protein EDB89DRAFT_1900649 [Lactarius sanguifluus]